MIQADLVTKNYSEPLSVGQVWRISDFQALTIIYLWNLVYSI